MAAKITVPAAKPLVDNIILRPCKAVNDFVSDIFALFNVFRPEQKPSVPCCSFDYISKLLLLKNKEPFGSFFIR